MDIITTFGVRGKIKPKNGPQRNGFFGGLLKKLLLLSGDSKSLALLGYCYFIEGHHLILHCQNWWTLPLKLTLTQTSKSGSSVMYPMNPNLNKWDMRQVMKSEPTPRSNTSLTNPKRCFWIVQNPPSQFSKLYSQCRPHDGNRQSRWAEKLFNNPPPPPQWAPSLSQSSFVHLGWS